MWFSAAWNKVKNWIFPKTKRVKNSIWNFYILLQRSAVLRRSSFSNPLEVNLSSGMFVLFFSATHTDKRTQNFEEGKNKNTSNSQRTCKCRRGKKFFGENLKTRHSFHNKLLAFLLQKFLPEPLNSFDKSSTQSVTHSLVPFPCRNSSRFLGWIAI